MKSSVLRLLAPAKVNLALHVLGRRADGYHNLDSIVAFAGTGDHLSFSPAEAFSLTCTGPFASALPPPSGNIITKAYELAADLARARGGMLSPVAVNLHKYLPVASGIGGGSSNAAAALRGFLGIAGITEVDPGIVEAALTLGADVPVCLLGRACRMRGIGEHITPLDGFKPLDALLVNPGIPVATSSVFAKLGLERGQTHGTAIVLSEDTSTWRNDLTAPAIALAPAIGEVLQALEDLPGVTRAFMSGSGATCVALLEDDRDVSLPHNSWWQARTMLY